jgi:hypothetical protein
VVEQGDASEAPISGVALALMLLAPYAAVLVFWVGFHNGWLAILAYHAQILVWLLLRPPRPIGKYMGGGIALVAASALAGPVLYFLLPVILRTDLAAWLGAHGLSGWLLLLMVPYFGVLHPRLEQLYWAPLRDRTPLAHLVFAGYHVIVLYSLLPPPWLAVCFTVLVVASVMWQQLGRRTGGLGAAMASHALADSGVVIAAVILAR